MVHVGQPLGVQKGERDLEDMDTYQHNGYGWLRITIPRVMILADGCHRLHDVYLVL